MTEEQKAQAQEDLPQEKSEVEPESLAETGEIAETTAEETRINHLAEKRGRMVIAGVLAAVGVSLVAVLVAGIFQLTSRWTAFCPVDLSVNDPAPVLWKALEGDGPAKASLGVPKEIADQAAWKGAASAKE